MPHLPAPAHTVLDAARAALDADDLPRAEQQASRLAALSPDHPETLLLRADIARAGRNLEEAAALYERAATAAEGSDSAWHAHANLAEVRLELGDAPAALRHARAAIELLPDQVDGWVAAARAHGLLGQPHHALRLLNEAVALEPQYALPHALRGELYAANRSYGDALNDFAAAIDAEPDNPRHYIATAQVASLTRDPRLALSTLEEGIAAVPAPQRPMLRELRARLLLGMGEREAGLRELDSLLDGVAEPPLPTLLARAEARFDDNDVEGALADFERVLRRDPEHAEALDGKADALLALERRAEARALLERLAGEGASMERLLRWGDFLWEEGEPAAARAAYEAAVASAPRHPLAPLALGRLLMAQGEAAAALPWLDLAAELAPHEEERFLLRSEALLATGQPTLAWFDADEVLRIDEGLVDGYVARAQAARALGRFKEADADLRRALDGDPLFGPAWAALARLRAAEGDDRGARELWQHYLALPTEEQTPAERAEAQQSLT